MTQNNQKNQIYKAQNNLLMIAIFSIIMLFAGLTSAYIVSKGGLGDKWDTIKLPQMFYISTILIVISSFFAQRSINYCRRNNFTMISKSLLITIILGCLFFLFQFLGWSALVDEKKFLSGNNVASSYLYVLTITHLLHLLGGGIALINIYFKSLSTKYNSSNFHGLSLGVKFWHFLGLLWLFLFLFLLIIN